MPRSSRQGPLTISIGNTLDVVVVRPNAFHSGSDSASSAASTTPNAAGSTPAIAALIATSSTVATPLHGGSTQSDVVGGIRGRVEQRVDRVVGCRRAAEHRRPSARSSESSYCARGSAGISTSSLVSVMRRPEQLEHLRVVLVRDRAQLVGRTGLERVGEHEDLQVAVTEMGRDVVRVHDELLAHDRRRPACSWSSTDDRVLDRERRARAARSEAHHRAVGDARRALRSACGRRSRAAHLRAGLDRDRRRAVAVAGTPAQISETAATIATHGRRGSRP